MRSARYPIFRGALEAIAPIFALYMSLYVVIFIQGDSEQDEGLVIVFWRTLST
jgi:hypothetical protein